MPLDQIFLPLKMSAKPISILDSLLSGTISKKVAHLFQCQPQGLQRNILNLFFNLYTKKSIRFKPESEYLNTKQE